MRIEVTAEDLAGGRVNDGLKSPIALALNRQAGGIWFVAIGWCARVTERATMTDHALTYFLARRQIDYTLPSAVIRWNLAYDRSHGRDGEPFAFLIDVPLQIPETASVGAIHV